MQIARDMDSLQEALYALAREGKRVALVPTMGALHAGHMALIERAKEEADAVVASIFINPKQFGPNEDFDKYPRMLNSDTLKLREAGTALVYAPAAEDIYPAGFSTKVSAGELGNILEGQFRPGFFDGVATVVAKLLLRVLPRAAVFGEKDYQQLCVIRRITDDLDIPVEIIGAPTVREADGLAMSSRNAYLSAAERALAPRLHQTMQQVGESLISGSVEAAKALQQGIAALTGTGFRVDYLELRAEDTLELLRRPEGAARLLAAAWLGNTRLIDNIGITLPSAP